MDNARWLACVVVVSFAAAACGPGEGSDSPGGGAAAVVIVSDDGKATLTVPKGALPAGTSAADVQVRAIPPGDVEVGPAGTSLLFAYALTPDGLTLSDPATLDVAVDTAVGVVQALHVSATGVEALAPTVTIKADGSALSKVSLRVGHFSDLYAVTGGITLPAWAKEPPESAAVGSSFDVAGKFTPVHLKGQELEVHRVNKGKIYIIEWNCAEFEYRMYFLTDQGPLSPEWVRHLGKETGTALEFATFQCASEGSFVIELRAESFCDCTGRECVVNADKSHTCGPPLPSNASMLTDYGFTRSMGQCVSGGGGGEDLDASSAGPDAMDTTTGVADTLSGGPDGAAGVADTLSDGTDTPSDTLDATMKPEDTGASGSKACDPAGSVAKAALDLGKVLLQPITPDPCVPVGVAKVTGTTAKQGTKDVAHDETTIVLNLGWGSISLTEQDLIALFTNTEFPCGQGEHGYTLCPTPSAALVPGGVIVLMAVYESPIPLQHPAYHYQYAFVFDADGVTTNNYTPPPPYPTDFFKGTDRWYEATYKPGAGWTLKVSTAAQGAPIQAVASAARLILSGNVVALVVPASEFGVAKPSFRITAFRHKGDYGLNPPYAWDGSLYPPVVDGLAAFSW